MKKILTAFIFSVLIMALVGEAILFRYLYLKEEERETAKAETVMEMESIIKQMEEDEKEVEIEENENGYLVLVDELPVYAESDISVNTESSPLIVLKRGEEVTLSNEGNPYSLIQYGETGIGYVWSDCIRSKRECGQFTVTRDVIVIDAGHQEKGNSEKEPIGPGETKTKDKTASGTQGKATEVLEYELTLDIALQVEEMLKDDYTVIMVRRTSDVNISNKERAMLANNIKAKVFVRIHADGSENPEARGAMAICNTPNSKYENVRANYEQNRKLSECVIDAYTKETDIKKNDIRESDDYAGINWCSVPVTIIEMGFMTNREEDKLMQDTEFQQKMAKGIATGIKNYIKSLQIE
ncbi:MAG: N-acetylmuramoyl-L-alanine amidase [Lachnospiraceae bacterium]|nr:N-acetylmuramoyl-L-alanine amidase [Lachnospiraceae bacterium]MDE7334451.1 N-acetylmuramoyl-L-alanine amidase [Lachnospiraceae bacterium]